MVRYDVVSISVITDNQGKKPRQMMMKAKGKTFLRNLRKNFGNIKPVQDLKKETITMNPNKTTTDTKKIVSFESLTRRDIF